MAETILKANRFPELRSILLKDDSEVMLDEYLSSRKGALLISFEKSHFPQIQDWMNECTAKGDNVYHIAVISNRFMLMRDMFIDGLRESFPAVETQNRTLITFTYLEKFCDSLGLADSSAPLFIKL